MMYIYHVTSFPEYNGPPVDAVVVADNGQEAVEIVGIDDNYSVQTLGDAWEHVSKGIVTQVCVAWAG